MMSNKDLLLSAALQQKMGFDQAIAALEMLSANDAAFVPVLKGYQNIVHELILVIKALKEMKDD